MTDILRTVLVGELVAKKGPLVSVPDTATVQEVLDTLVTHNISAVPVAGSAAEWVCEGGPPAPVGGTHYIGIVSILDVVSHIADNLGQPEKELGILAVNIIGQSIDSRALWTLEPSTKLNVALERLCNGVHRFVVQMEGAKAAGDCLLTQTDIIRFFHRNLDHLGTVLSKTVADIGCLEFGKSPMAVPSNMPLVDVLRVMRLEGGLTEIAVVETMVNGITPGSQPRAVQGGKMVGTISASDFRSIKPDTLRNLTEVTVEQFLNCTDHVAEAPLRTCRSNSTLATVLGHAISSKAHRMWVTNADGWLSGVVTFSDMIRVISQEFNKVAVANS